jgi:TDG/mug DNA glycosylase family protein
MILSTGFPPVERADATILILGSLPGQRSIAEQQYYAHPQNAFWRIMQELFDVEGDYRGRCQQLVECRIALWDVLMSSFRPGSMDADISLGAATPNDFAGFFSQHASIRLIAFNGRKADQLFRRFVDPQGVAEGIRRVALPSTSPAYASLSFSGKVLAWRDALVGQ